MHQVALFDADAMFAGQTAAHLDAEFKDLGPEFLTQLQIARFVGIKQDQRMHITVARVKHIPDLEPELIAHLFDPLQHEGQRRYRDGAIQTHVIVDLPHRTKGRFATQPDFGAFLCGFGLPQLHRIMPLCYFRDQAQLVVNLRVGAFHLDDQQRLAHGITSLGEGFRRLDAGSVHKFDRDRQHPRLDDVRDTFPRNLVIVEPD